MVKMNLTEGIFNLNKNTKLRREVNFIKKLVEWKTVTQ